MSLKIYTEKDIENIENLLLLKSVNDIETFPDLLHTQLDTSKDLH